VVSDQIDLVRHAAAVSTSPLSIKLDIPVLHVAVISPDPLELALASLNGVLFSVSRNCSLTHFKFYIHSLKIDDLDPSVPPALEVVALGRALNENHFLEFRASMFTDAPPFTAFDDVTIDIQPLQVFADIAFVSDMIAFANNLVRDPRTSPLSPPAPSEKRFGISNFPLSARLLRCGPLTARLHVINKSGRQYHFPKPLPLLKICPNIVDGVDVRVEPPVYRETAMTYGVLEAILRAVSDQIISQLRSIVTGVALSYPPFPPIGQRFARTKERCHDNKAKVIGSAAFQPVENVFRTAQQVLSLLRFDDDDAQGVHGLNQRAGDVVVTGFKQAGGTLLGAFTGLVLDPIRESKKAKYKSKVLGGLAGVAKGIAGVALKPAQAVLQAGAGLVTGARKSIEGDDKILKRERDARVFLCRQIIPHDRSLTRLRDICFDRKGEMLEDAFPGHGKTAVVTPGFVWLITQPENGKWDVEWVCHIKDVVSVKPAGESVVLVFEGKQERFVCKGPNRASEFVAKVSSQAFSYQKFAGAFQ
jgi:hypothetical protein